ncbi:hypothetical protein C8A01DRAFT_42701 [Parachaetomium inaequale]|uniref:Uncharacterized protein n=1 Tax=Parachaetomium inaequale TaxID=2588326 RepID=A0AAN6PSK0_9PEZI|nr:hypothetical protein C8A01DRAFT_42701 [Parachaetomium inaequale]
MSRPVLLALLYATVLGCMVEAWPAMSHGLNHHSEFRAELLVEPRQWRGPPWLSLRIATTTTTLTLSVPGATSPPSLTTTTGPTGSDEGLTPTGLSGTSSGSSPLSSGLHTAASPDAGNPLPSSTVDRQLSSEGLVTDTMPTDTTASTGTPPTSDISASSNDSGLGSNRTLVITLSTVLSAVGLVLFIGAVVLYRRKRQHRLPFLSRGVSPIDDDEIERWKSPRGEKGRFKAGDTDVEADAALNKETGAPSHAKQPSTSSVKKPPSVIVYSRAYDSQGGTRHSTDAESRRSFAQNHPAYGGGKTSFDKALPQTPIQARAPNARAGLTDDSVPGDEPFLFSPKRTPSRLSKLPPNTAHMGGGRRVHHARARSSRSSTRSFGEYYYYGGSAGGGGGGSGGSRAGSDLELSPRYSQDHVVARHSSQHSRNNGHRSSHSRVYSSSSIPPRLSFGDDVLFGGLSPARPRFPGEGEIGRAIG